jgi:signal transduction histidine kinase
MAHATTSTHDAHRASRRSELFDRPLDGKPGTRLEGGQRAADRFAALGEMTGGIAHDFRNILTIIGSSLRLLEANITHPERMRLFIVGARGGVERGLRATSQLLTFARQHELEPVAGDVNGLLRDLELFLKYGAGPGASIVLELSPGTLECVLEPSQFNAAILNLVLNARDAMSGRGTIRISTTHCKVDAMGFVPPDPGAYVRVRVRDEGVGMPDEILSRIFDPLFTTKGEMGTGLGLSQVGTFMRLIGGHIGVSSELGVGTTFDLFFRAAGSIHDGPAGKIEVLPTVDDETG